MRILNANSKCPYGECDGSGMSLVTNEETGDTFGRYCRCREHMIQEKRIKFANIPHEFKGQTLKSFRIDWYSNEISRGRAAIAKKAAVNFVMNYETFEKKGKGLYFYSYVKGSGKTRLAVSIGNALIATKKAAVKFTTTLDLLHEIKKSYDKETLYTQSQIIEALTNVQCLILDDIGVEKQSEWVKEIFYSLIDHRMTKKKVTIFTSNVKIDELKHDERIKNRIERMAVPIYLPDESIRSQMAQKENEDLTNLLFK